MEREKNRESSTIRKTAGRFLLAVCLVLLPAIMAAGFGKGFAVTAYAQDLVTASVIGTYDQTEARSMLAMINAFRQNEGTEEPDQAWWLDPNGSGEHVPVTGLEPLVYDYELEAYAMQRAAEIAISFDHVRPDGTSSLDAPGVFGENILGGPNTAADAFEYWLEAEEPFEYQGHRRNMLGGYRNNGGTVSTNFLKTIGIGHFACNGVHYWVQCFGEAPMETQETEAENGEKTVPVNVLPELIDANSYQLTAGSGITLEYHRTFDLADADVTTTALIGENRFPVESTYTWECPSEEYVSLTNEGTALYGNKVGTGSAAVTNAQGKVANVPVTVTPSDIADAVISPQTYELSVRDGINGMTGDPVVTVNGETLTYFEDYRAVLFVDGRKDYTFRNKYNGISSPDTDHEVIMRYEGMGNYTGLTDSGMQLILHPAQITLTNESGSDQLSIGYGDDPVSLTIASDLSMTDDSLVVLPADPSIVAVSFQRGDTGYTYRRPYTLTFTPLSLGETTVDVYLPVMENRWEESNHLTFEVTVTPPDLANAVLSGIEKTYGYTGAAIRPKPVVTYGGETLTEGTDYTVTYLIDGAETDEPVGSLDHETQVELKVTGTGDLYTGSKSEIFTILPFKFDVSLDQTAYPYRASGAKPVPTVSYQGETLIRDRDYTLSWGDNNVVGTGTGTVTVTGTGDYSLGGSIPVIFDIVPADLADAVISPQSVEVSVRDGINGMTGDPVVTIDGETLTYFKDYRAVLFVDGRKDYTFSNQYNGISSPDTDHEVIMRYEGLGNYTGLTDSGMELILHPAQITLTNESGSDQLSMGNEDDPLSLTIASDLSMTDDSLVVLPADPSIVAVSFQRGDTGYTYRRPYTLTFTPLSLGETTVDVYLPAKENRWEESNHLTFTVTVAKIAFDEHAQASFVNPQEVARYTFVNPRYEHRPEVNVYYDNTIKLESGTDYTVSYNNNIYAGTATVVITPVNTERFSGHLELPFTINTAASRLDLSLTEAELEFGAEKMVTFSGILPASEPTLQSDNDQIKVRLISFDPNAASGQFGIKAEAFGSGVISFSQEADNRFGATAGTVSVSVIATTIPEDEVELIISDEPQVYDGSEKRPAVTVKARGITLDETYYEAAYAENTTVGTAAVTVTGKNGLTFTKGGSFAITAPDKSPLEQAIEEAQAFISSVIVSEDGAGVYASQIWMTAQELAALQEAVDTAAALYESGILTQAQIEAGISALSGVLEATEQNAKHGTPLDIKEATVTLAQTSFAADGKEKKPAVSVTHNGRTFAEGQDYETVYSNNVNPGTASVTVTGKRDLTGTTTLTFIILPGKEPEPGPGSGSGQPENPGSQAPAQPQAEQPSDASVSLEAMEQSIFALPDNQEIPGSLFHVLQAKAVPKSKTAVKLSWKGLPGMTYRIYGNACGRKNGYQFIADVSGTSFVQKGLKKGTYYKYLVAAVQGGRVYAVSRSVHVATKGGKAGNSSRVALNSGKKLKLKKGRTSVLKAQLKNGSLKVASHRKLAFESDNEKVATVSKKGKVKAVGKGSCYVYAYAQNGLCARVKVTVR